MCLTYQFGKIEIETDREKGKPHVSATNMSLFCQSVPP